MPPYLPEHDPEFLADPYPHYELIRSEGPAVWDGGRAVWLVTPQRVTAKLLATKQCGKDPRYGEASHTDSESPLLRLKSLWILLRDGTYHRRLRDIMTSSLSRKGVLALRKAVQDRTRELTADLAPGAPFDAARELAPGLPFDVVVRLLGLKDHPQGPLREWSRALFATLEPGMDRPTWERGEEAAEKLSALLTALLTSKNGTAASEALLLHDVREAYCAGYITLEEGVSSLSLMFIAGHETTAQMIGNVINALAVNQADLAETDGALSANPAAVNEFWRYDGAVQNTMRLARKELDVGGRRIAEGDRILFLLGAANRDPTFHQDPGRLDLARNTTTHLGFGGGPHYCLGAALAQLEITEVVHRLARIGTRVEIAGKCDWNPSITFRGPLSLPVVVSG
ncbi:cytochrome P450 [Streptomyces lunalinharesii]|uniref:Cytochrome P450 n=1 Tax=Streptomyces lunalinharesii TaxID=333384 RepID=A0ABN3SKK0_9ACTN